MKYLPDKRKPVEEGLSPRQKEKLDKEKEEKERKEKERTEKDKERAEKEKKEREEKERKEKEKEKKEKDKRNTKDKNAGVAEGLRRQSVGAWNALKSMINNDKTWGPTPITAKRYFYFRRAIVKMKNHRRRCQSFELRFCVFV